MRSHVIGSCYLLHFDEPFYGQRQNPDGKKVPMARHYLGWSEDLITRLRAHSGRSDCARLVLAAKDAGIGWQLARVWTETTRFDERRLKNRGGRARLCPICLGTGVAIEWQTLAMVG